MNTEKEKSAVGAATPATEKDINNSSKNSISDGQEKIKRPLKVLVACEESQRVCTAFRELGHEAYSCDIQKPCGGHPEWHILGDVLRVLNPYDTDPEGGTKTMGIMFETMDGWAHFIKKWDLIIAHPPCTYLTNVATRHHSLKCSSLESINARTLLRIEAMQFFMDIANADCEHIAIENPVGVMNTCYRKSDQIIHPYMFAESVDDTENYHTKATCLWTKGLPLLIGTGLQKPDNEKLYGSNPSGKVSNWEERQIGGKDRAKNRSKTFPGIARAMAEQWGGDLMHSIEKLTPGQRKGIIAAYTKPAAKPGIIVERIRKLGVSVSLATTYLFSRGYISYDDKLHLDRFS